MKQKNKSQIKVIPLTEKIKEQDLIIFNYHSPCFPQKKKKLPRDSWVVCVCVWPRR